MERKNYFEIKEEARTKFIDDLVSNVPEGSRIKTREASIQLIKSYEGADMDALSILYYAAERGRFDEFAEKLSIYFVENLSFVHPMARRIAEVPGAVRAVNFFLDCYTKMGIQPNPEQK